MEKDTTMEVIEFLAKTGHFLFAGWILMLV